MLWDRAQLYWTAETSPAKSATETDEQETGLPEQAQKTKVWWKIKWVSVNRIWHPHLMSASE